jgi:hypothetical protein
MPGRQTSTDVWRNTTILNDYSAPEQSYYGAGMKPAPAPDVPGNTEAERMDNAVRKLFTVSKEDYLKEEARLKKNRDRKKRRKG